MVKSSSRPLAVVLCEWPRDRELVGQLLRSEGADARPLASTQELRGLLAEDRVDLALIDSGVGLGRLEDLLSVFEGSAEARDLPIVLLTEADDLPAVTSLTALRFNVVLLPKPVAREQLATAVRAGLRLQARQRQNRELVRQLASANAELERQRAEAAEDALRKTRFLSAISHDIRTPVNAMVLTSHLLREAALGPAEPDVAEVRSLTEGLQVAAGSLIELVNDLLDIARYDQGKLEYHESDFAIGPVLSRTLEGLRPLAEEKGLTLEARVGPPGAVVRADPIRLARVVQNLVSNAIKFTDRGGVRVACRASAGAGLTLEVIDTGCGIPEGLQESIFDEFAQLRNPERDRTKGTGLGLAICRRLVSSMGGEIAVASAPGRGSTFAVTLPAWRVVSVGEETPDPPARAEPPARSVGARHFSGRVLVVEDHEPSRQALRSMLRRTGLDVDEAPNGREALGHLGRGRADLVLLDLMMPELGGLEVLRILRARPETAALPVVVLTGDVAEHGDDDLLARGATASLSKPVDFARLIDLVARYLPEAEVERQGA